MIQMVSKWQLCIKAFYSVQQIYNVDIECKCQWITRAHKHNFFQVLLKGFSAKAMYIHLPLVYILPTNTFYGSTLQWSSRSYVVYIV